VEVERSTMASLEEDWKLPVALQPKL
jgi:hypothetical protein